MRTALRPSSSICEHASNYMPARYRRLGLPEQELSRHIAWDIGAAELTRQLATRLDAVAFLAGASRLLVDCNRPLDSPSLIPEISEIPIPGNRNIGSAEKRERVRTWFEPLHTAIARLLDERKARRQPAAVIGVHSFTPVLAGVRRPMNAGVLFGELLGFREGRTVRPSPGDASHSGGERALQDRQRRLDHSAPCQLARPPRPAARDSARRTRVGRRREAVGG